MSYSVGLWNFFAEGYARKPVADEQTYQRKLAKTQQYLSRDMHVLEFGCGTGSTALVHAPVVKSYRATDVSPKMIEIAHRRLAASPQPNLTFEVSPMEELSVPDASLDAILGLSILHLLRDPDDAIRQTYRMLKPGGTFISSTVCTGHRSMPVRLFLRLAGAARVIPRVQPFTRNSLKEKLGKAGFRLAYEMDAGDVNKACFLIVQKPSRANAEDRV